MDGIFGMYMQKTLITFEFLDIWLIFTQMPYKKMYRHAIVLNKYKYNKKNQLVYQIILTDKILLVFSVKR